MAFANVEEYAAWKAEEAAKGDNQTENTAPGQGTETKPAQAAGATGAPAENQEEKVKRDRTLDGRISELTAKHQQELAAARKELEDFKTSQSKPKTVEEGQGTTPAAKVAEKKAEVAEMKKLTDFVATFPDNTPYEEILDAYQAESSKTITAKLEARFEQMFEERTRKAEEKQQAEARLGELNKTVADKLAAVVVKYPDFNAKMAEKWVVPEIKDAVTRFIGRAATLDAIYHLASDPASIEEMKGMDSDGQLLYLGELAAKLKTTTPDKPKQAISKVHTQVQKLGTGSTVPQDEEEPDFKGDADARGRWYASRKK